jgi:hypothetical protein
MKVKTPEGRVSGVGDVDGGWGLVPRPSQSQ